MTRILLSWSNPAKAEKYREALAAAAAGPITLLDADGRAVDPEPAVGARAGAGGLLVTGGPDGEPGREGEVVDPEAGVDSIPTRDALEWRRLEEARERRLPVLAICRGHQVVHAFLGGRLWQDLGRLAPASRQLHDPDHDDRRRPAHELRPVPGASPLHQLIARHAPLTVNSLHHQAVREPGRGLETAAVAPDDVIEASVLADPAWWVWTAQWHPEELAGAEDASPLHRELFTNFLAAAHERSLGSGVGA